MKKSILSKIIMWVLMVGIFLLPISPSLEMTKSEAQSTPTTISIKTNAYDTSVKIEIAIKNTKNSRNLYLKLYDKEPSDPSSSPSTPHIRNKYISIEQNKELQVVIDDFDSLDPKTPYWVRASLVDGKESIYQTHAFLTTGSSSDPTIINQTNTESTQTNTIAPQTGNYDLECSIFSGNGIIGCIALVFYVVWEVSALVAQLAGQFLDFLVYYSTNSTSYRSEFISKGWGAVKDVANIFFIIALLYIAIKMILSLDDHHGKKMITTIIMVALIINFSLFITQVVIDGSNILAKVFYNNIDSKYENKNPANGAKGEKSISVGLIDKYNPKSVIDSDAYQNGRGSFIFVTLLLIGITLYSAYIFFTVGMLFISRVVMLWFSMIFAPIAFASYTLPFDIPGLGHREWWKQLFENAFLAPLFIFMLYLIVMFADFLKNIFSYPPDGGWMMIVMSKVIPFLILSLLLMKAKELAVKYAGEMGGAVQKFGSFVGGAAVGVVAGAGGFALRATAGRAGATMANSKIINSLANEKGWFGRTVGGGLKNAGNALGKGSFDVRGVKIAGKNLASTGLQVGTAQSGGFEKARENRINKRQKKADKLEVGNYEPQMREYKKVEADKKTLEQKMHSEKESIEKTIAIAKEKLDVAHKTGNTEEKEKQQRIIENQERKKEALEYGTNYAGDRVKQKTGKKIKVEKEVEENVEKKRTVEQKGFDGKTMVDQFGNKMLKEERYTEKVKVIKQVEVDEEVEIIDKSTAKTYGDEKSADYKIAHQNGMALKNKDGKSGLMNKEKILRHGLDAENARRRENLAQTYEKGPKKIWNQLINSNSELEESINRIRSKVPAKEREKKSHDSHGGGNHGASQAPKHEEKSGNNHNAHDNHEEGGSHAHRK